MIARWREEEKKWREGEKDKVERVGMIAAEGGKGDEWSEREREGGRINQYVQLHSAFLKSYFSIRHHLGGEESSRKGQRDVEWWAVQPDQHQPHFRRPRPAAHSVARRAGAVGVDPHQTERATGPHDVTQGHVLHASFQPVGGVTSAPD